MRVPMCSVVGMFIARPLRRVIQRHLQNRLATSILEGAIADGDMINVSAGDDGLVVNGEKQT